jgi:hypothetical protein
MWGLFIGVGLGVLQVLLLRKTTEWITSNQNGVMKLAVIVIIFKLVVILGTLFLLALADRTLVTMLWGAGGLAVVMVLLPIILNRRQMLKMKKQEDDSNGNA